MGVVTSVAEEAGASPTEIVVKQVIEQTVPPQAYFRFEKKVSADSDCRVGQTLRQYESASASCSWPFSVNPEGTDEENQINALNAENNATARVLSSLGYEMTVEDTDYGARIVEASTRNIQRGFPGTTVEPQPTAEATVGPTPPHDPGPLAKPKSKMTELEKAQANENTEWAKARLASHPHEFYDNRADKASPNHPDYRHKDTKIGVWAS